MMPRNGRAGGGAGDGTYGGTTKITTLSSSSTVAMQNNSSQIQWTEAGGVNRSTTGSDDMQRNHMLDAIAVGVVHCFVSKAI